jgi:hypothetical protein
MSAFDIAVLGAGTAGVSACLRACLTSCMGAECVCRVRAEQQGVG